ncbi:flagellar hook protein FlgE [Cellulosilyticum ruminicola]|uniref:flagellar hook protein FlgE n=1 Tax=Cellulosilyticum ruminicola TaxID=425254 RepID=UPI0006CF4E95|nr:flagellar hook protein FlgE [Cellulosilyticum ruminicola]
MMRSMFSGVSGLKVHQTKMDVIGNNIANVNTVGYKSQRVTFSDVFSQTLQGASSASDDTGRGGLNPMQVGLGVKVSSIDMLMTQGAAQRTDNPFDLMINGSGFIVVGDATGQYFTRAGALRQDDEGNLTIANGMRVQGWPSVYNEKTNKYEISQQEVSSINLADPTIKNSKPSMTTKTQLSGNICNTADAATTTIRFYDSVGNPYTLDMHFKKAEGAQNQWNIELGTTIKDSAGNEIKLAKAPTLAEGTSITFTPNGSLDSDKGHLALKFGDGNNSDNGGATLLETTGSTISDLDIDISGLTQYAVQTDIDPKTLNGNAAGTLTGYSVGSDGIITASYNNGDKRSIAQVVVAEFDNPEGLEKAGENLYTTTTNSGDFDGVGKAGIFNTGVLEMSNVDLSSEFTDMIITQRGFQANSRIISVSDEMLQELTQLK